MDDERKKDILEGAEEQAKEKNKGFKEVKYLIKLSKNRPYRQTEAIEAGLDLAEVKFEESEEEIKMEDLSIIKSMAA